MPSVPMRRSRSTMSSKREVRTTASIFFKGAPRVSSNFSAPTEATVMKTERERDEITFISVT